MQKFRICTQKSLYLISDFSLPLRLMSQMWPAGHFMSMCGFYSHPSGYNKNYKQASKWIIGFLRKHVMVKNPNQTTNLLNIWIKIIFLADKLQLHITFCRLCKSCCFVWRCFQWILWLNINKRSAPLSCTAVPSQHKLMFSGGAPACILNHVGQDCFNLVSTNTNLSRGPDSTLLVLIA